MEVNLTYLSHRMDNMLLFCQSHWSVSTSWELITYRPSLNSNSTFKCLMCRDHNIFLNLVINSDQVARESKKHVKRSQSGLSFSYQTLPWALCSWKNKDCYIVRIILYTIAMVSVSRFCISGKLAASDTTLVFDTLEMLEKKRTTEMQLPKTGK